MGGEVANIAEVANKVSKDIFSYFKWEKIPVMDENFDCHKAEQHVKNTKHNSPSHPVDVVFGYFDPYLNENILLNTDLKSYAKGSISKSMVKSALNSLGKTIDCARGSSQWQQKYVLNREAYTVRGMLFVYNHDDKFDRDFNQILKEVKTESVFLKENQILHIFDPDRIRYLLSVVADMNFLMVQGEMPKKKYSFYYPDLYLHKAMGDPDKYPATAEMLCSPYMILKFDDFTISDDDGEVEKEVGEGYIIYYNRDGKNEFEFLYLFDALSRYQILSSKVTIKIRVAHANPYKNIKSIYQKAINQYVAIWGFDDNKKRDLERIDFDVVKQTVSSYIPGVLAWRSE